jgi:hypothetical protein
VTEESSPAPRWGLAAWAVVLTAFAVGFANFPLRVIGTDAAYLPGDWGDNRLNNFVLEHGYRYFTFQGSGSFWSASLFYPALGTSAWTDLHLGMLPVYAALRLAGLSPEGAFQGYFLVPFALNFAAAAWATRRLGFGPVGAAVCAYLFAFGLPLVAQITHLQLLPRFLAPPAVALAWEYFQRPRGRKFAAVAACVVGQLYLTVYIAYFLGVLLATGAALAAVRFRRQLPWPELLRPGRAEWVYRARVAGVAAVAAVPLLVFHAQGAGRVPIEFLRFFAPEPAMWLTPADAGAALPDAGRATGFALREAGGERQLGMGAIPLAALAVGLLAAVRPGPLGGRWAAVAVGAWATLLLALLVTRYGSFWPYELLTKLPGGAGVRAVGRIVLVLLFPAGLAVAATADALVRAAGRLGRVPAAAVAVAVLAAVATDQWLTPTDGPRSADWDPLRYSKAQAVARQARLVEAIRSHPNPRLVYVFPSAVADGPFANVALQIEAMRAAQDAGVQCVNGYSGYFAIGWSEFRGYRELLTWLTETNHLPPDVLAGLVVIGEPEPDADPQYEAAMRAAYPPRRVGSR